MTDIGKSVRNKEKSQWDSRSS